MRKGLQDFDPQGITPDYHITGLVRVNPVLSLVDQNLADLFS